MNLRSSPLRWVILATVVITGLAAIPLRAALLSGQIAGDGPDVVTTLWVMWWMSAEGLLGSVWGGHSDLFNYPFGGHGAALSPLTAMTWMALRPLVGEAAAATLTDLVHIALIGLGIAWLARETGLSRPAALFAGVASLAPRYLFYATGESSVVAISALPMIVGLIATVRLMRSRTRWLGWAVTAALCIPLQGVEGPYWAPVLPGVLAVGAIVALLWRRAPARAPADGAVRPPATVARRLVLTLAPGLALLALSFQLHRGTSGEVFPCHDAETRQAGTLTFGWTEFECVNARARAVDLVWPERPLWAGESEFESRGTGRDYLGLTLLVMSLVGVAMAGRRAGPWFGLGLVGIVLAMGSNLGGDVAGPFALLNTICERAARALTQPTRYLMLAHVGLAVSAAWGVAAVARRWPRPAYLLAALVVADALVFGGLSLRLPTLQLPQESCIRDLRGRDGAVLVWPWDGANMVPGLMTTASAKSQLLQLVHQRPGATIGTGNWPLSNGMYPELFLMGLGWDDAVEGTGPLDTSQLADLGFRWVISDQAAPPEIAALAPGLFGTRVDECPGYEIYYLEPSTSLAQRNPDVLRRSSTRKATLSPP